MDWDRHGETVVVTKRYTTTVRGQTPPDLDSKIAEAHSIAAGLDYPGVGPAHAELYESGRATYHAVGDDEALAAFEMLARAEGILPALESRHAVALVMRMSEQLAPDDGVIVINLSGRGDKDLHTVLEKRQVQVQAPAPR